MTRPFPEPQDKYPVLYLKDTDIALPQHVVNNKLRYGYFKTIAKGGKCVIQSCKDFHLSRVVAYKSLKPELADDPYENQRFLREARVTAMLQHPNTVPVYELSRDNAGKYYFTMKMVEGDTLREILTGEPALDGWRPVPLRRVVDTLIQVCHALDYAHSHGVVHRDVKPANILIGPFGEVLLLDWGLAKVWGMDADEDSPMGAPNVSLTGQGRLQGTVLYMSPEQVEESPDLDHRSDIYSLGAVLYEVLTGGEMITGRTLHELMSAVLASDIVPPSERTPERDIPAELEEICLRAVALDPNDRYDTAHELLTALHIWSERG
jgi:serine/threonine-protein kinase